MGARVEVIKGYKCNTMKDERKNLKIPEELWKWIKEKAKKNNRKIIDQLKEDYKV